MSQVDFFARERGEAAHRIRLDENENSHPTPLLTFPFCMSTALSVKEKKQQRFENIGQKSLVACQPL